MCGWVLIIHTTRLKAKQCSRNLGPIKVDSVGIMQDLITADGMQILVEQRQLAQEPQYIIETCA